MSDWSWRQAVAERVLQVVNEKASVSLSLDELYEHLSEFQKLFPRNRHVKEKVRQVLQKLRDSGFLVFEGGGVYSVNLEFEELESERAPLHSIGIESPVTKQVFQKIRLRNTLLGAEIKHRYRNTCQVCRVPVLLGFGLCYAEAHHLWPLGAPHFGPDVPGNIIVVCPNHHVMFDRAAVTIVPGTLSLRHIAMGVFRADARLYLEPWHSLNSRYVKYHHRIFEQRGQANSTPYNPSEIA